jgi:hypothetical protein
MTTLKKDLIKKAAHGASARREAGLDPTEHEERDINLGPFFTAGVLLIAFGLRRRKKLAVGAGLASIWIDQRSAFGRSLTKRIRDRAEGMAPADVDPTAAS